jgi:hypothetical protein
LNTTVEDKNKTLMALHSGLIEFLLPDLFFSPGRRGLNRWYLNVCFFIDII